MRGGAALRRSARFVLVVCFTASAVWARDRFVTVASGVRLFVKDVGHGSPVVVLHGGPGMDSNYLVGDFAPLTKTHRVIFYDQRGAGRSTLSTGVTADQLVEDLESLRRKLGFDRLVLLGHSWGAGLAALYASAHPDHVDRMILADAIPARLSGLNGYAAALDARLSESDRALTREALAARREATTPDEHVASCRAYWSVFAKAYFSDPAAAARDKGDLCASSGAALANGRAVNLSVMASLGDYDWREAASRFTMPVLVIHGEADPIRLENAREWADTIQQARLVVLPHAGHMSYFEAPDQFFATVNEFLGGQ